MRDVTIQDLVFTDTVKRNPDIDKARLLRELCLAALHANSKGMKFRYQSDLNGCLIWRESPQGQEFWERLYARKGFPN